MLGTMSVIIGVILGIVLGISEWLPISSKTQVLVVSHYLLNLNFPQAYSLALFLEGGAFIAALIYFRNEVYAMLLVLVGKGTAEGKLFLKYLVVVSLVTAIIAIPIYKFVESLNLGPVVGIPMIILGIMLIVDGLLIHFSRAHKNKERSMHSLKIKDMILIGIAQGASAFPGISRSGATVSTMLFLKIKPEDAFRLSFIALIVASIGSTGVTVLFSHSSIATLIAGVGVSTILIAVVVCVIVSLIFINILLKFAHSSRITTLVFALGILALLGGFIALLTGLG